MRLSHLADYAVVLMTAAARRAAGARLSATELAAETGVPLPTAQKLMGQLAGAGLFTSARGVSGGFALSRAASQISLADGDLIELLRLDRVDLAVTNAFAPNEQAGSFTFAREDPDNRPGHPISEFATALNAAAAYQATQ